MPVAASAAARDLAVGPMLFALLVVLAYPETAGLELEQLNPEDVIVIPD